MRWRECWGACCGVGALAALGLLHLLPALTERLHSSGALAWPSFLLAWIWRPSPWAGADILLPLATLGLLARSTMAARRLWAPDRAPRRQLLRREALWLLNAVGLVFAVFSLCFGYVYARPALAERWSLPEDSVSLAALADHLVALANAAYVTCNGSEDLGQPTPHTDAAALGSHLDASFQALAVSHESRPAQWPRPRARQPLLSPLMDRLGLSGFFFPWTGEANVNRGLPGISWAHALAHEKAHQRGFAGEHEANFVAILAGGRSEAALSRYAALLFAQRQALRALALEDTARVRALVQRRHAGVQRDIDDLRAYWARFEGPAQDYAQRANDLYLKAHRVEGGATSYAGSLGLLLRYAGTDSLLAIKE